MAETTNREVNRLQEFRDDFQKEFVRSNEFTRFMSSSGDNVIWARDSVDGESTVFPFVSALRGQGVVGDTALEGREENLENDSHRIWLEWRRNAVKQTKKTGKQSAFDLLKAGKSALRDWANESVKYQIIAALMSVGYETSTTSKSTYNHIWYNYGYPASPTTTPGATGYAGATQLNNWCAYNGPVSGVHSGKILFGAATSNYNATFATAAANIDTTNDKMSYGIVDIAKGMAQNDALNPRIKPYTGKGDKFTEETYVCLMHPIAFQSLRDSLIASGSGNALQNAEVRGRDNPLWRGGDLWWNGVLCTACPGLPVLLNIGSGGNTSVVPSFLLGKNAVGFGWQQLPNPVTNLEDYGFRTGAGIEMCSGAEKLLYTNPSTLHKEQTFITVFTSAGY